MVHPADRPQPPPSSPASEAERVAFLERDLHDAIESGNNARVVLRETLLALQCLDPQQQLAKIRRALDHTVAAEDYRLARALHTAAMGVMRDLPQYALAGLWRGLYPGHGQEIVRIQYSGTSSEELVAVKVTGDECIPKDEVTFRAKLARAPVDVAADNVHWRLRDELDGGVQSVLCLPGEGQQAGPGFTDPHFVAGALYLVDSDRIGFLWKEEDSIIVFRRMPPEEAQRIEQARAERHEAFSKGDLSRAMWDVVCDFDDLDLHAE